MDTGLDTNSDIKINPASDLDSTVVPTAVVTTTEGTRFVECLFEIATSNQNRHFEF